MTCLCCPADGVIHCEVTQTRVASLQTAREVARAAVCREVNIVKSVCMLGEREMEVMDILFFNHSII